MQVAFGENTISGQHFKFKDIQGKKPDVCITTPHKNFVFIMYNQERTWLHWLVTNNGEFVRYAPPTPPQGTERHTYVFALFQGKLSLGYIPLGRIFDLSSLTDGLGFLDAVHFTT